MAEFTGDALAVVTFLMGDGIDKEQLWDLSIHKEPHTNQQRKYFHRLVSLLARGEQRTFFEKKNELIRNYGNGKFIFDKEGKPIVEYLPDNDSYKYNETKHYYPLDVGGRIEGRNGKGIIVRAFLLLEGTSQYNIKEYLALIDGTRNECLGSGIPMSEVETYEEKRLLEMLRMKANAEVKKDKSVRDNTESSDGS